MLVWSENTGLNQIFICQLPGTHSLPKIMTVWKIRG